LGQLRARRNGSQQKAEDKKTNQLCPSRLSNPHNNSSRGWSLAPVHYPIAWPVQRSVFDTRRPSLLAGLGRRPLTLAGHAL
jgi:hypothetical protein